MSNEKEKPDYDAKKLNTQLKRAKIQLLLKFPFWGKLISTLPIRLATWVPTAATDGTSIAINPYFMQDSLKSLDKVVTVLAHEAGHAAFLHPVRCGTRDKKDFNIAADYIINGLLKDSGINIFEGLLHSRNFDGMNTDQVYSLLDPNNKSQKEQEAFDDLLQPGTINKDGSKNKNPKPLTSAEITALEQQNKIDLAQAAQVARAQGSLPAALERLVDDIIQGKINWKEHLRRFCTSTGKDDYSWSRPNRRFRTGKFFLPSMYSEAMGPLLIAIDTSGSVDKNMLNEFAGEVNKLIDDCSPERIVIMYCDTEVAHMQTLEKTEQWVPELKGGGGTRFAPVFAKCEEIGFGPACCLYFTDLYCNDFGPKPPYPVMWINWGGNHSYANNLPFGEKVDYEPETL